MKVTNNKIGTPNKSDLSGKADAVKSNRSEGGNALSSLNNNKSAKESAAVSVSDRAQMMQKSKDIASGTSIDEAKVARLQKLIDEGKYKVDADKIADRLLDEHMSMPD
jgi:flagellar biosynthesis anti-sigma factor FlgM